MENTAVEGRQTHVSILGSCVLRVLWMATVFNLVPTLEIIFISYPISWFATGVLLFIVVFSEIRRGLRGAGKENA